MSENSPSAPSKMIQCTLGRVVLRDDMDWQTIYLVEEDGQRGFPIIIGSNEAREIDRVLHGEEPKRPLTHKLAVDIVDALQATLKHVDVVALRDDTFYAQIALQNDGGDVLAVVDARPSDAIALAVRARCPIRVAEEVLERAAGDK